MSEESAEHGGEQLALTLEEKQVIRRLKALAKAWPPSLWLFAGPDGLAVMKKGPVGEKVHTDRDGFDPAFKVDEVAIDCDGGDWD